MRLAPPLTFAYGNIVFGASMGDPWALERLETASYDGLTREGKLAVFRRLLGLVTTLGADFQILRVASPWRPEDWMAGARACRGASPRGRELERYLVEQRAELRDVGASQAHVFLAVRLAPPSRDVSSYLSQALEHSPRRWLGQLREEIGWRDVSALRVEGLEALRGKADRIDSQVDQYHACRPAAGAEVQWLVRRAFCRGLGEPLIDGLHEPQALIFERNGQAVLEPLEADVTRWMDSYVEHGARSVRVESELGTSWQAGLVVGALPELAAFPSPRLELMFAQPESLPFGVDMSLNCRYLPNELATRLVRRQIQNADMLLKAETQGEQGASDQAHERTDQVRDLLAYLQGSSRPPLLRATLAIQVAAADEQQLEERVEVCRDVWGDEIKLHRPPGSQLELFLQQLPAQPTRTRGYDTVLTPLQVAAMVPTATHRVGAEGWGFYLGHTLSGSKQPVLFNLAEGSERNKPTVILLVGSLGAGKTIGLQKLLYEGFLQGARILDVDPKGDHRLHELEEIAPHAESITLAPSRELRGLLDPLRVAPAHLRQDATVAFLTSLLPPGSPAEWQTEIVQAVHTVIERAGRQASCFEVVRALEDGAGETLKVARTLHVHSQQGLSQLGFADPDVKPRGLGERQLTYIAIAHLPQAAPGKPRREWDPAERVGEQIIKLVTLLAIQILQRDRARLKLFSFDEGWRLLEDDAGRSLLMFLSRMGRSELAVPIIGTQQVTDVMSERSSLENLLGATLVFGMGKAGAKQAAKALALLGLDSEDVAMRERILAYEQGECLLRDHDGRIEQIQVALVPRLLARLSTTPREQAR